MDDIRYNVGDAIQFRVMDGSMDMPHKLNNEEYEITFVHNCSGLEKGYVIFGIRQKLMTKGLVNYNNSDNALIKYT
jgi:hypothetical protein